MMAPAEQPEVRALYEGVTGLLNTRCANGMVVGNCRCGVYLFYDYDGEPIYVGKTWESLRTRIRRHLTNQRTDAVAMHVLDPFEVAEIEMWPFWDLSESKNKISKESKELLSRAEFTVYQMALEQSTFGATLNEGNIPSKDVIEMPPSIRGFILAPELRAVRKHPDLRIARRAQTFAELARVISERQVKVNLRTTLLVQAQRLEYLARSRLDEVQGNSNLSDSL